jgi:carbon storage regulator
MAVEVKKRGNLVVTRRTGERIMIGDDVVITLVGVVNGRATIAVTAPIDTEIHREENLEENDPRRRTR